MQERRPIDTENQIAIIPASALCLPSVRPAAPEWFPEFVISNIRHHNTRRAYACQVVQFLACCKGCSVIQLCKMRILNVAGAKAVYALTLAAG